MGVSIKAANSTFTFDCGSGGFFNLRKNIALALDPEFGSLSYCLVRPLASAMGIQGTDINNKIAVKK